MGSLATRKFVVAGAAIRLISQREQPVTGAEALSAAFDEICAMHGSLNERLAAYVAKMRELKIPFAEANDELVAKLKAADVGSLAPAVGDIMPPFLLPSHERKLISLEEMLAKGPTVISLNRGHWCPFCRIAIGELATMHDTIEASGAEVVSINRCQATWRSAAQSRHRLTCNRALRPLRQEPQPHRLGWRPPPSIPTGLQ